MGSPRDVTVLLGEWSRGNRTALNQLLPLVYAELRRVAARQLRTERADHTLQPTALVHEVFIRLVDQRQGDWQNRAHFFGVAANVMRRILVDHARRHGASKRGEGVRALSIDEARDVAASNAMPILALDQALDRLETVDADLARIVELRAFGGLTIEEAGLRSIRRQQRLDFTAQCRVVTSRRGQEKVALFGRPFHGGLKQRLHARPALVGHG